jgi:hypothetical protein
LRTDATVVRRIEAAAPAPLIDMVRHAGALANGADMDIVMVDQPDLLAGVGTAAAGQGGHALLIPLICGRGKPLDFVAVDGPSATASQRTAEARIQRPIF